MSRHETRTTRGLLGGSAAVAVLAGAGDDKDRPVSVATDATNRTSPSDAITVNGEDS